VNSGERIDRFLTNGPVHVSPSIADVDGDNRIEIFFYDWLGSNMEYQDTFWL
jgi:hypothetical protein